MLWIRIRRSIRDESSVLRTWPNPDPTPQRLIRGIRIKILNSELFMPGNVYRKKIKWNYRVNTEICLYCLCIGISNLVLSINIQMWFVSFLNDYLRRWFLFRVRTSNIYFSFWTFFYFQGMDFKDVIGALRNPYWYIILISNNASLLFFFCLMKAAKKIVFLVEWPLRRGGGGKALRKNTFFVSSYKLF